MELGELGDYKSAPSGRPHQPLCLTLCSNIAIVPTPLDHQTTSVSSSSLASSSLLDIECWQVAGDGRIRTAQQLRERMVGCNTPTAWV
ncbi:BZ3500_MvSof-1268-A1-R1_Chr3-1g05880 [Microbotryum saponariae]|uniref:BZ3500_MvSof-1268-A1-R1_Chr3-1g05880 protein n=1 Tax=Microbotryum saponariae TaxID=289078 RepID=A0A2X0LIS2_9BASI|nr:BZ3500_MvSof-1268-A1-R1_Chr3-1g05880 [Microbotryum saponariae]SDA05070.1 BZ3501_MvSof-1269-A2-R1_Chr3-1g05550 [Microbotryum saponariae]